MEGNEGEMMFGLIWKLRPVAIAVIFIISGLPMAIGQSESDSTFRISTNLVVVNVVAIEGATSALKSTLTRDDFELFDNKRRVPIRTFDAGSAVRPLNIWFLVQCTMPGWEDKGSGLFQGQINQFKSVLADKNGADTFGVAHWCDDGTSELDLSPTKDVDSIFHQLEGVLSVSVEPESHTRSGELALQAALEKIVQATRSRAPDRIPVVVFLYDDYSAMPKAEADHFVDQLLSSSVTVFGLRDDRSPHVITAGWIGGEQASIATYIATQTGGSYLSVGADQYADGLQRILSELHARYELGFTPGVLDGKRHNLQVRLSSAARKKQPSIRLKYRSGYIASSSPIH